MRLALVALALIGLGLSFEAQARGGGKGGSHSVRGYVTKKGAYVAPHHATNPNGTQHDNWSARGNVNPYTGKAGTKTPAW